VSVAEVQDWRHRSACRGEDPELWTVAEEGDEAQLLRNKQAREICATRCPVVEECAEWAAETMPIGTLYAGREWATELDPEALPKALCEWCKGDFVPATVNQLYCADWCRDAAEAKRIADAAVAPVRPVARIVECATPQARRRHRKRGEACPVCRITAEGVTLPPPSRQPSGCGTPAGVQRHRKKGEEVCDACQEARRAYEAQRRRNGATRGNGRRPEYPCGTWQAYNRHKYRKEPVDKACRAAQTAHWHALRAARVKAAQAAQDRPQTGASEVAA
jgi:hypothetical protein